MRLLSAIVLILLLPASLSALEIRWKDQVAIQSEQMTLGDLADIYADRTTVDYLAGISFGPAPLPGRDLNLDSQDAQDRLLAAYPQLIGSTFAGADTIQVHRTGQLVEAARIENLVRQAIARETRELKQIKVTVKQVQTPDALILPEGRLGITVRPLGSDLLHCRSVQADFTVNGELKRRLTIPVSLQATARVVAAAHDLKRGTILTRKDLTLVERDVSNLRNPLFSARDLTGKRLKRPLRRHQIFSRGMVTTPPVVKRGEPVTIALSKGAVRLEARGIARRDGKPGETIPVTNISSRKIVLCRVLGPGIVTVEF